MTSPRRSDLDRDLAALQDEASTAHEQQVRARLTMLIMGRTATTAADAIIARFPWITEQPRLEHGHTERKSDAPFDPEMTHVYAGQTRSDPTHWRNVTRYVTTWKEQP